jgi:hypothetical protein
LRRGGEGGTQARGPKEVSHKILCPLYPEYGAVSSGSTHRHFEGRTTSIFTVEGLTPRITHNYIWGTSPLLAGFSYLTALNTKAVREQTCTRLHGVTSQKTPLFCVTFAQIVADITDAKDQFSDVICGSRRTVSKHRLVCKQRPLMKHQADWSGRGGGSLGCGHE